MPGPEDTETNSDNTQHEMRAYLMPGAVSSTSQIIVI